MEVRAGEAPSRVGLGKKEIQMPEDSTESEEERDLEELYKDGRKPTLKELADIMKKHDLKLVSVKFPSVKDEENPEEKS